MIVVAVLLSAAVVLAWVRRALWQRAARPGARRWRIAVLAIAQPALAGLLYLTLAPPAREKAAGTLVVATAGANRFVAIAAGERLVALPEAGRIEGATRVPDLGSALRMTPGIARVRVVGDGLVARDRPAATTRSLVFVAPPPPNGIVALDPPAATAPGDLFTVATRIAASNATRAELLDPSGRVVDTVSVPSGRGTIALIGTARTPGIALFTLRLRDDAGAVVEQAAVPLQTNAPPPARVSIVAGAPGPEVKALRRWATDAGLTTAVRVGIGGGATLSDASTTLDRVDTLILDDRSWGAGLPAIAQAVRGGMGLVVRVTGPVPRGWQVLGLGTAGGANTAALVLPPAAPTDAALAARRGPGTREVPATMAGARDSVPVLTRQAVTIGGAGAVPLLRDARGVAFAAWRAVGRGRVAIVTMQDSFALVTSGHGDRHGELWSRIVSTVARPLTTPVATIDPLPRAGARFAICGAGTATMIAPDASVTRLLVDVATGQRGCAGYWPTVAGWHWLTGPAARAVYVYPADTLLGVYATERRDATMRLIGDRGGAPSAAIDAARPASWPWFLAWLAAASLLWWFERTRIGRRDMSIAG